MLIEVTDRGTYPVKRLAAKHLADFHFWYDRLTARQRRDMERAIDRQLDEYAAHPHPRWGSIFNTSIEGSKASPVTGVRGDWTGTPFEPLYTACNEDEDLAAMIFGTLYKLRVIDHPREWFGVRNTVDQPTFPSKDMTLAGKTYFLPERRPQRRRG